MTERVTPAYLLQLFRGGKDTYDLAYRTPEVVGFTEAEIVKLLIQARSDEYIAKRMKALA